MDTAIREKLTSLSTVRSSSFETERTRNLHVSCHYQDMFKCLHSDFTSKSNFIFHCHTIASAINFSVHITSFGQCKIF